MPRRRGFYELEDARVSQGGDNMRQVLGPVDLICMGIGMMLGAG